MRLSFRMAVSYKRKKIKKQEKNLLQQFPAGCQPRIAVAIQNRIWIFYRLPIVYNFPAGCQPRTAVAIQNRIWIFRDFQLSTT